MGSSPVVSLRRVTKTFHRDTLEVPVLRGIDLETSAGDFFALMGPSGSGKSTVLNLIAGIDRPTSGEVRVAGSDLASMSETDLAKFRARHVGFIFQMYNLIPVLTAEENVALPLLLTPLSRKERREHVETALGIVGLTDRAKHFPRQLSGGQEQRVAIARAIVTDPTLLLADEPTGDLDAVSATEILELLRRLNAEFGKTILLVTHDPRAAGYARTRRFLDKGVLGEMPASFAATAAAR
ncbi:MAG TPA: ABC transporter ATP-binding protein [Planctomycetota bacterium]|nr:ABC transporter ATP-binding protein [Planctomycetota bacterium]